MSISDMVTALQTVMGTTDSVSTILQAIQQQQELLNRQYFLVGLSLGISCALSVMVFKIVRSGAGVSKDI